MPHALWSTAQEAGRRPFFCMPEAALAYADLVQGVTRLCAFFDAKGLVQGDRVLIVTEQEQAAAAIFVAAILDGVVPVMLTPGSRAPRIGAIRSSTEARLVFCDRDRAGEAWADGAVALVEDAWPRRTGVLARVFRPRSAHGDEVGFSPFDSEAASRAPKLPAASDDLAYLLFTSGTTGAPSGVKISRGSLAAHLTTLVRVFSYGAETRIFNATPLAHTDGVVQGPLLALASGGSVLRPGPFAIDELDSWLNRVRGMGASHMISNPTILDLIDRHAPNDDYFDSPGFQGIVSSASILRPALWERFEQRFSTRLFNLYGMTETVANATYAGDLPGMGSRGTIGRPIDCEARVDTACAGGDGESVGELQLRGDNIFSGYWKNAERTSDTLLAGGWMRTGDLARARPDGSYELLGRIKTVINCGGALLRPEEIDEVLMTHPAVAEAVTVGVPDPVFEEFPVSAVVAKQGEVIDENALIALCREQLEALKVPKRIVAVERIPRGDAGKPALNALREDVQHRLESVAQFTHGSAAPSGTLAKVIELASTVFHQPVEMLSAESSPETVPAWDSFTHLHLILAVEQGLGCKLSVKTVVEISRLSDLAAAIDDAR